MLSLRSGIGQADTVVYRCNFRSVCDVEIVEDALNILTA